jgi:hypothetical protein
VAYVSVNVVIYVNGELINIVNMSVEELNPGFSSKYPMPAFMKA